MGDLSKYTVLQLTQYIEANTEILDTPETVALYEDWLLVAAGTDKYIGHFNLGALHQKSGQLEKAEVQYRSALLSYKLPEARYNLGLLLEQRGRTYEALFQWRTLIDEGYATHTLQLLALDALMRGSRRLGLQADFEFWASKSLALNPDQPTLKTELTSLTGAIVNNDQAPHLNSSAVVLSKDPIVYVVAVCFNEATILPFFLDHYINFVGASKVILHDGGSTDATAEIVARFPQAELVIRRSEKLDDRDLMNIRNEEWKKYREQCDWMVVCDVDEFLYHPQIREKLIELKQQDITLPMVEGFEMLSKTIPDFKPGEYIWSQIQTGTPNPQYYNKNLIFQPSIDINYTLGCHHCLPTGPVKRSEAFVFKNLHYRMLSHQHIVNKSRRAAARLSDWNKQTNAGFHYRLNAEMTRSDYNNLFIAANNVVRPRLRPIFQRDVFDVLQGHLLALNQDACILEIGVASGFGASYDSGSTEFFAWYVHNFGGRFFAVDADPRLLRHARRELDARGLSVRQVSYLAHAQLSEVRCEQGLDLLFINSGDYLGDEKDLQQVEQTILDDFMKIGPHLTPHALVVLDGMRASIQSEGKFQKLVPYLLNCQYSVQQYGNVSVFSKTL